MPKNFIPDEEIPDVRPWAPEDLEPTNAAHARMLTAAELERLHHDAYLEGYETGRREGHAAGYLEGQAQARSEADRLKSIGDSLVAALNGVEQELSNDLLALSLDIAKQILRQALKAKPELLLPVVRSAMESLSHNAQHPHIHLHPEDAVLVRAMLEAELPHAGWKVMEDMRIDRGGCRIETSTSELDATLPSRWQRIVSALGQEGDWLEDEK